MALYEHVFLARQDLSQAQVDALAAGATEIVEANGGRIWMEPRQGGGTQFHFTLLRAEPETSDGR